MTVEEIKEIGISGDVKEVEVKKAAVEKHASV